MVAAARPGVPILAMPHPSPVYVVTAPDIAGRLEATLAAAAAIVAKAS